ncbi:hypothetical protein [Yinghuangia seranimata]|uniref:hypothetical protein n=1 Tax=Yinghuangia seranimata TaxID=408067 RepID=UPI00248AFD54|nr:hypothetical protein [Yinghuangia seranimata]MDI2129922.1 hypothetical protein [Yinghuangia seranimata]
MSADTADRSLRRRCSARRVTASLSLALMLAVPAAPEAFAATQAAPAAAVELRGPCDANDNLGEIANNFISRCRKGSIRSVFPGQHYGDTLGEIRNCAAASCKTAWKLLNDNRFKK